MYVRVLVELPAEGGMPRTDQSYITFNTFNTFEALQRMMPGLAYWSELTDGAAGWTGDR